jgi:hypothetical protein
MNYLMSRKEFKLVSLDKLIGAMWGVNNVVQINEQQ